MNTVQGPILALVAMLVAAPPTANAAQQSYVEVQGPSGLLKGTMLAPEVSSRSTPVVLIVPGSGPTDRDGNNPLGIKAASYRLLAEGLAAQGITSVRIDKRGMFASGGAAKDANHVTMADYAADAHAWAAMLRKQTGAPCIWIAGHSEGSLVALLAAQTPQDLCGLVLLSGAGRRLGDIVREQLRAQPGATEAILAPYLDAIDKLEKGQKVELSPSDPLSHSLFAPQVQDFLIDQMRYDPAELLKTYAGPVMVLRGDTDIQVSAVDADRLAHARADVVFRPLSGVNHVLKKAPANRVANFATYSDPSLPIADAVVDAVAAFVQSRARR